MTHKHRAVEELSPNSKLELMKDVAHFRKEIANNYEAIFHERLPQDRLTYSLLLRLVELFDNDKQFAQELADYLKEIKNKRF